MAPNTMQVLEKAVSTDLLTHQSMTAAVNERKTPLTFLRNLIFGREKTYPTETLELSTWVAGRKMAPMVRKNSEAVMVTGIGYKFATVEAPNIRIKRPFSPSELLWNRRPGNVIFADAGTMGRQVAEHIADDLNHMDDQIVNREEWMCAQAIQGTITYNVADQEIFTVTYPKPGTHTYNAAVAFWDQANSVPHMDLLKAKRLMSTAHGLQPNIVVLGAEAADAFLTNTAVQNLLKDAPNHIGLGKITFEEFYSQYGLLYLGRLSGLPVFEYSAQVEDENGNLVDLIRPKYAEVLCTARAAQNEMAYGAIPDLPTLKGKILQAKRFSKSWTTEDPPALTALVHSRPLPILRRAGSVVSIKAVSG